jgi:ABC-type antimicrobial peptide transport system permease subunit
MELRGEHGGVPAGDDRLGGLFGVPAADLGTFVVPLVLVIVAAVACWVSARRAARVDPAVALSAE